MHSRANLNDVASRKAALRVRIAVHRERCAIAAARVVTPLVWLDRSLDFWQRIAPFVKPVAAPLAARLLQEFFPRSRVLRGLLRWGLPVLAVVRRRAAVAK